MNGCEDEIKIKAWEKVPESLTSIRWDFQEEKGEKRTEKNKYINKIMITEDIQEYQDMSSGPTGGSVG